MRKLSWIGVVAALSLVAPMQAEETPAVVPLFDNLGTHHHPVTTRSPQAQQYFDQGLRFVYGFNHDEAIRAFKEAARLDPKCAMAYWGIAFALGPNYNLPLDDERNKAAFAALEQAVALAPHASKREQAYISALAKRYSLAPDADRKALDRAFADAMGELARRYPDDLDAATLYAESLMDLRPWDLWTLDGQPQPGTLEIVRTLEMVLAKDPNHPGANHYYIHAVEASPNPERALPSAQRLGKLVPGAGHLVHMPSHVYMRVGRYADAADANTEAIAVDRVYIEQWKPDGVYPMMYYPHNIHFLWAAASMEGRSGEAIRAGREVSSGVSEEMVQEMPMVEYFAPTSYFALVRFGRWDEMLREPEPPASMPYARAMWHYGRGRAFLAANRLDDAQIEQAQVAAAAAEMAPDRIIGDNTPAISLLRIASAVLAGEIAARRGELDAAVRELTTAVQMQDQLPYTEPPPWYYPIRQSLGAVLLSADRPAEAEAVYREDLKRNPGNGWSLYGLAQSLRAQRKNDEAAAVDTQFRQAWTRADVTLPSSRF